MIKVVPAVDKPNLDRMFEIQHSLMEKGVRFKGLDKQIEAYQERIEALESQICEQYNIRNVRSPKQVAAFLERCGDPRVFSEAFDMRANKWKTDGDVMERLEQLGIKFASEIKEVRSLYSRIGTLEKMRDVQSCSKDGMIHPSVERLSTNRVSYANPPLMSVAKDILWDILAPRKEGNVLVSADMKNQEPLIMANMFNIKVLKECLESSDGLYESLYEKAFWPFTRAFVLVRSNRESEVLLSDDLARNPKVPVAYYVPIAPIAPEETYYKGRIISAIDVCTVIKNTSGELVLPETVMIRTERGTTHEINVRWDVGSSKGKMTSDGEEAEILGFLEDPAIEVRCTEPNRKLFKVDWIALNYGSKLSPVAKIRRKGYTKRLLDYFLGIREIAEYHDNCRTAISRGAREARTAFNSVVHCKYAVGKEQAFRSMCNIPIQGTGTDILSFVICDFEDRLYEKYEGNIELYYSRNDEVVFEVNREYFDRIGKAKLKEIIRDIMNVQVEGWVPLKTTVSIFE